MVHGQEKADNSAVFMETEGAPLQGDHVVYHLHITCTSYSLPPSGYFFLKLFSVDETHAGQDSQGFEEGSQ